MSPLYEYECSNCKKKFEKKQAIRNIAFCPKCGAVSALIMSIVNHKKVI